MSGALILGIHVDTHDTGAAVVRDRTIVSAANEERFSRIKEDENFPEQSIHQVLSIAGAAPPDLTDIAISGFAPSWAKLLAYGLDDWRVCALTRGSSLVSFEIWNRQHGALRNALSLPIRLVMGAYERSGAAAIHRGRSIIRRTEAFLRQCRAQGFKGGVHFVPHNLCHLATAYYTSGFRDALLFNIEGSSFQYTTDLALAGGGRIQLLRSTPVPHSAGQFYKLVTAMLGFRPRRHAGKITGLAAYGNPERAYHLVESLLTVNGDLRLEISDHTYHLMAEYYRHRRLPSYFGSHTREDLSAAFQRHLEVVTCRLVEDAIRKTRPRCLALSGGVAGNVRMNQRLAALPGIEEIFVHPGMGDTGQALGAALHVAYRDGGSGGEAFVASRLPNVFLGPEYSEPEMLASIRDAGLTAERMSDIEVRTAELLAAGRVVARFWGRMEYGPRALGNRSILYRPDDPGINDWLNKRLQRTEFMPFAPATLPELAAQCYVDLRGKEYTSEFMTITCDCTEWMRKSCPGVVHVDGTARPQLVTADANPGFHRILREFHRLTGLPSVINTSFNMHEEPIVCTPKDAIRTFRLGHLDHLTLGPFLLSANPTG